MRSVSAFVRFFAFGFPLPRSGERRDFSGVWRFRLMPPPPSTGGRTAETSAAGSCGTAEVKHALRQALGGDLAVALLQLDPDRLHSEGLGG